MGVARWKGVVLEGAESVAGATPLALKPEEPSAVAACIVVIGQTNPAPSMSGGDVSSAETEGVAILTPSTRKLASAHACPEV